MNKEMILDALNSRYCCLNEPLHEANVPRFLTSLRVYGPREDDEPQSLQTLSQHTIDPQILKKKITAALSALIFRDPHVLVQFWLPDTIRKRCMLTNLDQPFGIGVVNEALYNYRLESEQRMLPVDREHIEELGPPGRVYRQKLPEWSLDIQGLPTSQNIKDSTACIHGYLSLPVLDPASGCCVGILELITLSKHVDYAFEVIEISKALKEQDLKTSNAFEEPSFCPLPSEDWKIQVAKIYDILKVMCDTHNLPLAQTWELSPLGSHVSHQKSLQNSCSSFNRGCIGKVCVSTAGLPFYVRDLSMWEFHKACMEQHLGKSRGVVGRALLSRCSSYCENVTKLSEEEYPLVHNACKSGLGGCFAIFLHGVKGKNDYVLEFFLPLDIKDSIDCYVLNLVQELKLKIEDASGFEMGDISSMEVIRPRSSMTEVDTPNGIIPHPFVTNVATIASGAYANVSMQKTRDKGNDAGEPSNRSKRNIKRKRDSLTMEAVEKHVGQPMDEASKNLGVSRSTLKHFLRDNSIASWSMLKRSNRSACATDSNQHFKHERSEWSFSGLKFLRVELCVSDWSYSSGHLSFPTTVRARGIFLSESESTIHVYVYHVEKLIVRLRCWEKRSFLMIAMPHEDDCLLLKYTTNTKQATNNVDPLMARSATEGQNDPVVFDSTTYMEPATNNVDPLLARTAMAHQNDPVVFDSTTHMEQATDYVDPLVPRTAMPHQNDPVVFSSTTYVEQATNDVDPLMPRTAMPHQNDPVVFNNTTYMEQATNYVDPLMDVDATDLNFVDTFPTLSGADFIDDQGSFMKMAGCSSGFVLDYLMEPDGIENPMAEIGMGLEGALAACPSPIGSGDMYSFGANSSDFDFSNLVFDDQLF